MAIKYHQISLKESFSDCKNMFMDDAPSFFKIMEQHFDIDQFVPPSFYNAFYQHLGRKRDYPLTGFLSALILQKIFSIPTDSLLILLLKLCRELRDFCGFLRFPMPYTRIFILLLLWVIPLLIPLILMVFSKINVTFQKH